jgi:hypothetical protein
MQIETTLRNHFTLYKVDVAKGHRLARIGKDLKKLKFSDIAGGNIKGKAT